MLYDTIGKSYHAQRRTDPRIASALWHALGSPGLLVNVGAGTGSYEPRDRRVVAVEPSMTMIRQRPPGSAPVLQAMAEQLPLRDKCASSAMAVLSVHHWEDIRAGLDELKRVARDRIAILTFDPMGPGFWLTEEYFPAIAAQDRRRFPAIDALADELGHASVHAVPIPRDCVDGLLGSFWARPRAYLDAGVRSGMSAFADLPGLEEGLSWLEDDLESGLWQQRYGHLVGHDQLDIGYRLVVAVLP